MGILSFGLLLRNSLAYREKLLLKCRLSSVQTATLNKENLSNQQKGNEPLPITKSSKKKYKQLVHF